MNSNNWEQIMTNRFARILSLCKTGEMTLNKVDEARDLLLQFKNNISCDGNRGKKLFLSQCEAYLKIVFKFSLQKSLAKQDYFMIRRSFHTLWSVIDHKNLCRRKFLLQKMTSTLDVYLSVDTTLHFSKEFLRLYTGLINASSKEKRDAASSNFKSYKLLGGFLKDSNNLEFQSLIVEVLLKLYLKKGFMLLLQEIIKDCPQAVLETENIYAKNELYRCVKSILKPVGIPSSTTKTLTLNCQVSIDGFLLIDHQLGEENIVRFDRKNKTVSFFCAGPLLKKICSFDGFSTTTSWEVLSFSAGDVESFAYTIKPISETLQMKIKIPVKCFNLCLENSDEERSNIIICIDQDERAHDILQNLVFNEFFHQFSAQKLNGQTQEETAMEFRVNDSSYRPKKRIKHSRTELMYLDKSLSPLSMKEPQKFTPKRSAPNLCHDKGKKRKISLVESGLTKRKISSLKEQQPAFSTQKNKEKISVIHPSLETRNYNDASFNLSFSKVEEWLRINPVKTKFIKRSITNSLKPNFSFAIPTQPVISKNEVSNLDYAETGSKTVACSETSSNLPLDRRIHRYLKQEVTTENHTQNTICSSQELLNILKDAESVVGFTNDNIHSCNDNFLNHDNLENVTNVSHQNIANTCRSSNSKVCFSQLNHGNKIDDEISILNDVNNLNDWTKNLTNKSNENENRNQSAANCRKSKMVSNISDRASLNQQPKKIKISAIDTSILTEHGTNRCQSTFKQNKLAEQLDDDQKSTQKKLPVKILSPKNKTELANNGINKYKNDVLPEKQLCNKNEKPKQTKVSTVEMSPPLKHNQSEVIKDNNFLPEKQFHDDSGNSSNKETSPDSMSPIIKRRKSYITYKDAEKSLDNILLGSHLNNDIGLLKSTSTPPDDLNNDSLLSSSELSILTQSSIVSNVNEEITNYEKSILQQNKFPIVLIERMSLELFDNNNLICKSPNQKLVLKETIQDLNDKNIANNEDKLKQRDTSCTDFNKINLLEDDSESDLTGDILLNTTNAVDKLKLQPHTEKEQKTNTSSVANSYICESSTKQTDFTSNRYLSSQSPPKNCSTANTSLPIDFGEDTQIERDASSFSCNKEADLKLKNESTSLKDSEIVEKAIRLNPISSELNKNNIVKDFSVTDSMYRKPISKDDSGKGKPLDLFETDQRNMLQKNQNDDVILVSKLTTQNCREDMKDAAVPVANSSSNLNIEDVDIERGDGRLSNLENENVCFDTNLTLVSPISKINQSKILTLEPRRNEISKTERTKTDENKTTNKELLSLSVNSLKKKTEKKYDFNIIAKSKLPKQRVLYKGNEEFITSFSAEKNIEESSFVNWVRSPIIKRVHNNSKEKQNVVSSESGENQNLECDFPFAIKQSTIKPTENKSMNWCANPQKDKIGNDNELKLATSAALPTQVLLHKEDKKTRFATKPKKFTKSKRKSSISKASFAFQKSFKNKVNQANKTYCSVERSGLYGDTSSIKPKISKSGSSMNYNFTKKENEQMDTIEKEQNCNVTSTSILPVVKRQLYKENNDTFVSFPGENLLSNSSGNRSLIISRHETTATRVNEILNNEKIDFHVKTNKTCSLALEQLLKEQKAKSKVGSKSKKHSQLFSDNSFVSLNGLEKNRNKIHSKRKFKSVRNVKKMQINNKRREFRGNSSKINIISDIVVQTEDSLLDLVFRAGIKGIKETPQSELYENNYARLLYQSLHHIFG